MSNQKKIIVKAGSPLLEDSSANILHTYPSGEVLLLLESSESVPAEAEELRPGLRLDKGESSESGGPRFEIETLTPGEKVLAYVELIGPTDREWLKKLQEAGIEILSYQPQYTYLCRGEAGQFRQLQSEYFVEAVSPLTESLKNQMVLPESGRSTVWIIVAGEKAQTEAVVEALDAIQGVSVDKAQEIEQVNFYLRIKSEITAAGQQTLLKRRDVLAIEPYEEARAEDEVANLILAGEYSHSGIPQGSYLNWLQNRRLDGEGVTIAIVDTGVDKDHEAFAGRIKDLTGGKKGWHGTFVAGHAAGDYQVEKDENGFIYGVGVAPKAEILAIDNSGVVNNPTAKCKMTVNNAGPSGHPAYIQNNSWGAGTNNPMNYTSLEAAYDRLVRDADPDGAVPKPLVICFSAGNSGNLGLTRPKAAKNVIVTGNSENYRPAVGKNYSDNIDDVYQNNSWQPSSHGNCGDQRVRPHLVAPGEWTASANYGLQSNHLEYISPKLTWGGGTSGASPKTAGACALLVQWWQKYNAGQMPSPAMLRALLVNGAQPLESAVSSPPVPGKVQGWGRLHLNNTLEDEVHRVYLDQSHPLKNRGDQWSMDLVVSDPTKPVKVSLAWTDPPGSINSGNSLDNPAIVNRLNLKLEAGGQTFHGNNFRSGWSEPGELPDLRKKGIDNTQNIFLRPRTITDAFTVSVEALDITTNCFDFQFFDPQQDFALVIHNAHPNYLMTPAELIIVIDKDFDSDAPDNGSPNSDVDDDDASGWWWEDDGDDDDSNWWDFPDGFDWFGFESGKRNSSGSSLFDESFAREIRSGIDLVEKEMKRIHLPKEPASESAVPGRTARVSGATREMERTIRRFLEEWKNNGESSPKKGILLVGKGTRFNQRILDGLRKLAFLGELYIVSDYAPALCYLAQNINSRRGIHFRYVRDRQQLSSHLRDAIAEAGGAMATRVHKVPRIDASGNNLTAYTFGIIEPDRKVKIRIDFEGNPPEQLVLLPPDGNADAINLGRSEGDYRLPQGVEVSQTDRHIQVEIELDKLENASPAGKWSVIHKGPQTLQVSVWTWSDKCFHFYFDHEVQDGEENKSLLTVEGSRGLQFSSVQVLPQPVCTETGGPSMERERVLNIQPMPRKAYDEREPATEAIGMRYADTLSEWMTYPRNPDGPTLLDVTVRINGADAQGHVFQRVVRLNKIELVPASEESRPRDRNGQHLIEAQISKVYLHKGKVKGLRLTSDHGSRDVRVVDPALSDNLTGILEEEDFALRKLQFVVRGSEVRSFLIPGQ